MIIQISFSLKLAHDIIAQSNKL